MGQIDTKKLSVLELKSLILDEQDKVEISSRNVQILRNELYGRTPVANMVEQVETIDNVEKVCVPEEVKAEEVKEEKA